MFSDDFIKDTQEILKKVINSCHQWYGMRVLDVFTKLTGGKDDKTNAQGKVK